MKPLYFSFVALALLALSCQRSAPKADAYGNFEADELIVGAEASGKIIQFSVEEAQTLNAGTVVGRIDSTQLVLKIAQLKANIRAVAAKSPAISAQLAVFEKQLNANKQQLATLQREKQRIENLLKKDAAVPKQLDDLNAQIEQVQRQMDVVNEQRSASDANLNTQKNGLLAEILPIQDQIAQMEDQIAKCKIVNPIDGTVLTKLAEAGEVTSFGKPLYKIANLQQIILRAYVAGDQLGSIKVGQEVKVSIDGPDNTMRDFTGKISWVSSKAEFTPKIIQTKDERVNLVYAIKILVPNDGTLKIGMPAEVHWSAPK
ncbi:MAG: HlyD family efflux transporter periplasmic adaptor subunit [Saprospiraceae bacterium]|nr:HlyD family efflux transporter periplasmic adaptor subunit [Saprospiraceae bacterium]